MARQKTGSIQQRGDAFRISYYDINHVRQFETCSSLEEAQRELAQRLADVAKGMPVSSRPSTVRFGELCADVVTDYKINNRRSIDDINARFRLHIIPVFGQHKAAQITTAQLNRYIETRQDAGAATGTINRELEAIRHAFKLGIKQGAILRMPHVPHLEENNTRSGFFSREEVERLASFLPGVLASMVRFGFLTGWRLEEIRGLQWRNVDFGANEIRLDPGSTKNREGRVFFMRAELRALLSALLPAEKTKKGRAAHVQHVFAENVAAIPTGNVFTGIGDFRKVWKTACHKAGIPGTIVEPVRKGGKRGAVKVIKAGRTFHDLRRSAAREFQRQGFTDGQIMRMCGWIHMLRGMSLSGSVYPFASVDSTDVARNHEQKPGRALEMATKWDAVQCPPTWTRQPVQTLLEASS